LSGVQLYLTKKVDGVTYVLLQLRKGGWADNEWDAGACGHVDVGENPIQAIIHEAKEEIGVSLKEEDIQFKCSMCKCINNDNGVFSQAVYNFVMVCDKWTGEPVVCEPDKTSEVAWFPIDKLPANTILDRRAGLENILNNKSFSNFNWYKDNKNKTY
jgi:8-oxo-dGTP pyrophosphatase MutT (NUDIX family)